MSHSVALKWCLSLQAYRTKFPQNKDFFFFFFFFLIYLLPGPYGGMDGHGELEQGELFQDNKGHKLCYLLILFFTNVRVKMCPWWVEP